MNDITAILNEFKTVNLAQVERVELLDRMEVKYLFRIELLHEILSKLINDYCVLMTDGVRLRRYENRYFDTSDLRMYLDHHNGKLNRYKVRYRKYTDTGNTFFEIKQKSNRSRTIKKRIEVPECEHNIAGKAANLLLQETGFLSEHLVESVVVIYDRITLVKKKSTERVTIDLDLKCIYNNQKATFPGMIIAEVKQPRSCSSKFNSIMRELKIYPFSFSKYCLGIATLYPDVKVNNFKPKLQYVNKLHR